MINALAPYGQQPRGGMNAMASLIPQHRQLRWRDEVGPQFPGDDGTPFIPEEPDLMGPYMGGGGREYAQAIKAMFDEHGIPLPKGDGLRRIIKGVEQLVSKGASPEDAMAELATELQKHAPGPQVASAQNPSSGPAAGGPDPQQEFMDAQRRFNDAPTDMNGELMDRARQKLEMLNLPPPQDPSAPKPWEIDGQNGPGAQVAEADTGTQSDASKDLKVTEQQAKNLNFWNRMDATSDDIDKFAPALMDRGQRVKGAVPFVGNSLVSGDYQQGHRAAGEWIVSILRPDTGATVTTEEWNRYAPIYIPEPGDGPEVLKDKSEARARAAAGLKKGLGIAEVLADELAAGRAKKPSDLNGATEIDGYKIELAD